MPFRTFFSIFETKKPVNKVTAASKVIEYQHRVHRSLEAEAQAAKPIDTARAALFAELTSAGTNDIQSF